ncbi:hypothetical protein DXU93_00805 [Brumimicrobium aurantiacum]|uniref:Outer membrane protein beta-barrel domain-containing protein n=1 Tax=Brumimicrobium aurantiacum TaxID=1737063 RepID=A0A3E1F113_9FLAO|nr:hypothetical protein DXU93_00805 [Brumimicrobium aurantiacum]
MPLKIAFFICLLYLNKIHSQIFFYENNFSFSTSINFDVEKPFDIDPLENRITNSLLIGIESKKIFNLLYYNVGIGYQQNRFKQVFENEVHTSSFYNFSTLELKIQIGLGIEKKINQTNSSIYFECGFSPDYLIRKKYEIENANKILIYQYNGQNIFYSNNIRLKNSSKLISLFSPYFNIGAKVQISERILLRTYCQLVLGDNYIVSSSYTFHSTYPNAIEFSRTQLNNTLIKVNRLNMGFRLSYSL